MIADNQQQQHPAIKVFFFFFKIKQTHQGWQRVVITFNLILISNQTVVCSANDGKLMFVADSNVENVYDFSFLPFPR